MSARWERRRKGSLIPPRPEDGRSSALIAVAARAGCADMFRAMAALVTTVVGSYPEPDWLIDRERLGSRLPPRVRARELWRITESASQAAQDDVTRLAVSDMERAGVDIVTDGEMRRESYSNRFATALDGVDLDTPGVALDRDRSPESRPTRGGPDSPHQAGRGARRRIPALDHGPADQDHGAWAVHDDSAGAERPLRRRPNVGARVCRSGERRAPRSQGGGLPTSSRSTSPICRRAPSRLASTRSRRSTGALDDGVHGDTVLHTCFGYAHIVHDRVPGYPFLHELQGCAATHLSLEAAQPDLDPEVLRDVPDKVIVLGVLDLGDPTAETAEIVAGRIRRALRVLARAPRRRSRLWHEVPAARARLREAAGDRRRRSPGRRRASGVTCLSGGSRAGRESASPRRTRTAWRSGDATSRATSWAG